MSSSLPRGWRAARRRRIDAPVSARLSAYLDRIGLSTPPSPDPAGVEMLQRAHRLAIPFENLDVRLGRGVRIDSDSVFDKLVARRRGGYCFEHNRLLGDMLGLIGVEARPLLARVRLGLPAGYVPPRTHTLLLLSLGSDRWIADAGFGGSYVPVLPLRDRAAAATPDGARHRLRRLASAEWQVERADRGAADEWLPQYTFDLAEVVQEDLEQANHWTSTRPGTRFTSLHVVSLALPDGFASLTDRTLKRVDAGGNVEFEIGDAQGYRAALAEHFRLSLSEDETAALPLFAL